MQPGNPKRGACRVVTTTPIHADEGTVLRDAVGKIRYSPVVSFDARTAGQRFNTAIIAALRQDDVLEIAEVSA